MSEDKKTTAPIPEEDALPIFEAGESRKSSAKKDKPKDKDKAQEKIKKKKSEEQASLTEAERLAKTSNEKTIFIVCACLLSPLVLLVVLAVVAFFVALFAGILLIGGAMALLLIGLALVGAVLAVVGIVYGAILLLTGEGIEVLAGQYELGIGITITGITVILSVLLYSGITELVPFLMKKAGVFFRFVVKKSKELAIMIYRRSTGI